MKTRSIKFGALVGGLVLAAAPTSVASANYSEPPVYETPELPEWCSPGYWKNHTDQWPIPTGALYATYFGAPTVVKKGGNPNPTLLEVVSNPSLYGGPATELVADLLSEMHPGIDYNGDRGDEYGDHDCSPDDGPIS